MSQTARMAPSMSSTSIPPRAPATTRAGSVLAGPSRLQGGTTTIAQLSQIATVEDVERVMDGILVDAGEGGEMSLPRLEEMVEKLMDGISQAFDSKVEHHSLEALYSEVIDRLQLLINTLTSTGLGALPLQATPTQQPPPLPELAKQIETAATAAYERRSEMRDMTRSVGEVLNGGKSGRQGMR